jgi:uncharacterized protein (TIGR00730 family)
MHRIGVYCGSNAGARPEYAQAAAGFARLLAARGIGIVYGGGNVGLMGVVADETLAAGGEIIGVIPQGLVDREVVHGGVSDLRIVESMHERKALIADLADAFVALPGGLGTLDELFEIWTWAQLGFHAKPCGLLNVADYFTPLVAFLDRTVAEGFVHAEHRRMLVIESDPERLLDRFAAYAAPHVPKWLDRAAL